MIIVLDIFGAPKISLNSFQEIEQFAPNLLLWAVPFLLFFSVLEAIISHYQSKPFYEKRETLGSVMVGVGYLFTTFLTKAILLYLVIGSYNLVPWRMESKWWTLIPCIILFDFIAYWAHRISHEQRFWWATHIPHHSGEHFNLSISFRLSWVRYIRIIFFVPILLLGFHPIIFFLATQISTLYQFFLHTEYIGKLHPLIESIFVTPSLHRVHHGVQEKFINKNYGEIFILWDRMFGTYQIEDERVVFGLTKNIAYKHKVNPFYITFHEFIAIFNDVLSAKGFRKKLHYIFGNPTEIELEKERQKAEAKVNFKRIS